MELEEVMTGLKAWFRPEEHKERDLPGGGRWFYVPWQIIRERLDVVCPEWEVEYSTPVYIDKFCTVTCTITIAGRKRQGVGNAELELRSREGKDMARGTPIERAIADAFKTAAEAWGVARYLDEQTDPKTKAAFIKYMNSSGDGRASTYNLQNEGSLPQRDRSAYNKPVPPKGPPKSKKPVSAPSAQQPTPPAPQVDMKANQQRAEALCMLLGCKVEELGSIATNTLNKALPLLDESEFRRVRSLALIQWGEMQRPDMEVRRHWGAFWSQEMTSVGDAELFHQWCDYLNQQLV
ncbi:hypothetical protein [Leptolyngbya sp. FACHB-16]|uniref:hypothetical protein n=1 Tax=unclassified Leptolyngbya TaxID=2650499 RepID=UPI0016830184|nr:hypothetical protein [Leptolyngbya sp. FACHB-16]MBD2153159.1 hypothetical protein [Leptolyngbya sp. FACHB-16]